jgi:hypothetical protein
MSDLEIIEGGKFLADREHAAVGDWLADCIKEGNKPLPILANVLIGLRAVWADSFALDEMACAALLMRSLDEGVNSFEPRPMTDVDVGLLQDRLQHLGLPRIGKDVVHQAADIRRARTPLPPDPGLSRRPRMGRPAAPEQVVLRVFRRSSIALRREHRHHVSGLDGGAHLPAGMQS